MKRKSIIEALSSATRRSILRLLIKKELHISAISKELGLSKPVIARHAKVLEESGLVERKVIGAAHVLVVVRERLYSVLDDFSSSYKLSVKKGTYLLDALKQISGISVKRIRGRDFVIAIDGEEGYYIYEVNGALPDLPMSRYKIEKNVTVELKKLYPVKKKVMKIKVAL